MLPLLATSGLEDVIRLWGPKRLRRRYGNVSTDVELNENSLYGAEESDSGESSNEEDSFSSSESDEEGYDDSVNEES